MGLTSRFSMELREAEHLLTNHPVTERDAALMLGMIDRLRARVIAASHSPFSELTVASFLEDLSERLRNVPVTFGVDGGDIDQLHELAKLHGLPNGDHPDQISVV